MGVRVSTTHGTGHLRRWPGRRRAPTVLPAMTASKSTGLGRQESIAQTPRVTAAIRRTAGGKIVTEYELNGRVYTELEQLQSALGGGA
jgi:hypothetical protein